MLYYWALMVLLALGNEIAAQSRYSLKLSPHKTRSIDVTSSILQDYHSRDIHTYTAPARSDCLNFSITLHTLLVHCRIGQLMLLAKLAASPVAVEPSAALTP